MFWDHIFIIFNVSVSQMNLYVHLSRFIAVACCNIHVMEDILIRILKFQADTNTKWSSRWDYILESMPHTNIQWFRWVCSPYCFKFELQDGWLICDTCIGTLTHTDHFPLT